MALVVEDALLVGDAVEDRDVPPPLVEKGGEGMQLTKSNVKRVSGDPGEEYLPLSRKFRAVVTGASSSGAGSSTEAGTLGATTAFPRNTRWYAGPP